MRQPQRSKVLQQLVRTEIFRHMSIQIDITFFKSSVKLTTTPRNTANWRSVRGTRRLWVLNKIIYGVTGVSKWGFLQKAKHLSSSYHYVVVAIGSNAQDRGEFDNIGSSHRSFKTDYIWRIRGACIPADQFSIAHSFSLHCRSRTRTGLFLFPENSR